LRPQHVEGDGREEGSPRQHNPLLSEDRAPTREAPRENCRAPRASIRPRASPREAAPRARSPKTGAPTRVRLRGPGMSGLRDAVKVVLALASMLISALLVHAYYGSLSPAFALLVTAVIAGLGGGLVF